MRLPAVNKNGANSRMWYRFHMQTAEFDRRIRARLSEIGSTPIGVAVQAGLPRDAIRSVLRGHPPNLVRADEICRALGIALTIGVRRAIPQSVNEAFDSQIATPPTVSPDGTRAEHFAHVVDGRLADLFEGIAETYDKARTDGERQLVVSILSGTATSLSSCLASMVGFGDPPIQSVTPIEELDR